MLVVSRSVDTEVLIGADDQALVPLRQAEIEKLAETCDLSGDAELADLAARLRVAVLGPVRVLVVDVYPTDGAERKRARLGVTTPTWLPIDRGEIRTLNARGAPRASMLDAPDRETLVHRGRRFHVWRTGAVWRNSVQGSSLIDGMGPTRQSMVDLAIATIDHALDGAASAQGAMS